MTARLTLRRRSPIIKPRIFSKARRKRFERSLANDEAKACGKGEKLEQATEFCLLSNSAPRDGLEARLRKAFEIWAETVLGYEYKREDGTILRVGKRLIDASWGESTATVDKFCRESKFSPILPPSHGKFLGAQHKPMAFQNRKSVEARGRLVACVADLHSR